MVRVPTNQLINLLGNKIVRETQTMANVIIKTQATGPLEIQI